MSTTQPSSTPPAGTDDLQPDLDRLLDALISARRLFERPGYRRRLRASLPVPVELTTLRVLRTVERAGATAPSIGQIADALAVDPSSASRFVDQATAAGYLERQPCEQDRRRSRVQLTATGRELLDVTTTARRELLAEATDGWPPGDIAALGDLLARLAHAFDRFEDSP